MANKDVAIDVPEAAVILKMSERMVRYMLKEGTLPGRRLGRQWVINKTDAVETLKRMETPDANGNLHWRVAARLRKARKRR